MGQPGPAPKLFWDVEALKSQNDLGAGSPRLLKKEAGGEPRELKHLSTWRKRNQPRFP